MCDVLHAYLWKLLAFPPPLVPSFPSCAKPPFSGHRDRDLSSINPPCFGERREKKKPKKKKKEIARYDLARRAPTSFRAAQIYSGSDELKKVAAENLLSSPRLES